MRNKIIENAIDSVVNASNTSSDFKLAFRQYVKNKFDDNAKESDLKRILTLIEDDEEDTLLSEDGIKTLNAYALKGYRLITDYPLFDKPTSREEFLDAFNVAMQFYEKKDS